MKKILFLSALILIFTSFNIANAREFNDVTPDYWAYGAIEAVGKDMYAEGYPEGDFQPDKYITRAEYATMLVKAIGQQNCNVDKAYYFDDITPSHWAYNYVIRAVDLGIFNVSGNNFYPDDYVARSEIITFLVNILKTEDITKTEALGALQKAYDDYADIPDWFKVTAGKAEVINVIAKQPPRQRYLDSEKNITRAQMAVFLYNLKKQLNQYLEAQIEMETSPTVVDGGIVIENVTRQGDIVTLP
ncbi:S-layer homology domain-containing protein, partial [bacterium]|nr:S-layer homology domain-containing protein [bacterium]